MRIEVVDNALDGRRLAQALRAEGWRVTERAFETLLSDGSSAEVVLLAGDVPETPELLRRVREEQPAGAKVVLLGHQSVERSVTDIVYALRADATFARPVPVAEVLALLESFRSSAERGTLSEGRDRHPRDPHAAGALEPTRHDELDDVPPRPRVERTMELGADLSDAWHDVADASDDAFDEDERLDDDRGLTGFEETSQVVDGARIRAARRTTVAEIDEKLEGLIGQVRRLGTSQEGERHGAREANDADRESEPTTGEVRLADILEEFVDHTRLLTRRGRSLSGTDDDASQSSDASELEDDDSALTGELVSGVLSGADLEPDASVVARLSRDRSRASTGDALVGPRAHEDTPQPSVSAEGDRHDVHAGLDATGLHRMRGPASAPDGAASAGAERTGDGVADDGLREQGEASGRGDARARTSLLGPEDAPPVRHASPRDESGASGDGARSESQHPRARVSTVALSSATYGTLDPLDQDGSSAGMGSASGVGLEADDVRESARAPSERAAVSPRLRELLRDADRRAFPSAPPLTLDLPLGHERPDELVPDDLIHEFYLPVDPKEDDPLDAFTYFGGDPQSQADGLSASGFASVGGAGSVAGGASGEGSSAGALSSAGSEVHAASRSGREGTPITQSPAARPSGPPSAPPPKVRGIGFGERVGHEQRGTVRDFDVLRLLWRLTAQPQAHELVLSGEDFSTLSLVIDGERVRSMDGPTALHAIRLLQREGRRASTVNTELDAAFELERLVSAGQVGRFEADRYLRRAREDALGTVFAAGTLDFCVRRAKPTRRSAPATMPSLFASLVETARRTVTREMLFSTTPSSSRLSVHGSEGDSLEAFAQRILLDPELVLFLKRNEGASLASLLSDVPADAGLEGLLLVLAKIGLVQLETAEATHSEIPDPEAAKAELQRAHEHALEGNYLRLLGLAQGANPREVVEAYERAHRGIKAIPLAALGLDGLEKRRAFVLQTLEEARFVLSNPRWARAYGLALFGDKHNGGRPEA